MVPGSIPSNSTIPPFRTRPFPFLRDSGGEELVSPRSQGVSGLMFYKRSEWACMLLLTAPIVGAAAWRPALDLSRPAIADRFDPAGQDKGRTASEMIFAVVIVLEFKHPLALQPGSAESSGRLRPFHLDCNDRMRRVSPSS